MRTIQSVQPNKLKGYTMATTKPKPLFTLKTNEETNTQFVELTPEGHTIVVKLANIFQSAMPNPEWVTQNETKAFGKVINYRSPNTNKRLKDVFNTITLEDKTLASTIAGEVVNMLSLAPVTLENDPLAGL